MATIDTGVPHTTRSAHHAPMIREADSWTASLARLPADSSPASPSALWSSSSAPTFLSSAVCIAGSRTCRARHNAPINPAAKSLRNSANRMEVSPRARRRPCSAISVGPPSSRPTGCINSEPHDLRACASCGGSSCTGVACRGGSCTGAACGGGSCTGAMLVTRPRDRRSRSSDVLGKHSMTALPQRCAYAPPAQAREPPPNRTARVPGFGKKIKKLREPSDKIKGTHKRYG